jgi:frataxin
MVRSSLAKLARARPRGLQIPRATSIRAFSLARPSTSLKPVITPRKIAPPPRFVSTSSDRKKHITPDGEAAEPEAAPDVVRTPAVITDAEYHAAADAYMERLLSHLERLEEESSDMDVEYSVRNLAQGGTIRNLLANSE